MKFNNKLIIKCEKFYRYRRSMEKMVPSFLRYTTGMIQSMNLEHVFSLLTLQHIHTIETEQEATSSDIKSLLWEPHKQEYIDFHIKPHLQECNTIVCSLSGKD